jgi:hypothetical protein
LEPVPPVVGNSSSVRMMMDDPTATLCRMAHDALNNVTTEQLHVVSRRGLSETDASLCMSVQDNLNTWDPMPATVVQEDAEPSLPPTPVLQEPQPHLTQTTVQFGRFMSPSDPSDTP